MTPRMATMTAQIVHGGGPRRPHSRYAIVVPSPSEPCVHGS
jgi:hypothetical protein